MRLSLSLAVPIIQVHIVPPESTHLQLHNNNFSVSLDRRPNRACKNALKDSKSVSGTNGQNVRLLIFVWFYDISKKSMLYLKSFFEIVNQINIYSKKGDNRFIVPPVLPHNHRIIIYL